MPEQDNWKEELKHIMGKCYLSDHKNYDEFNKCGYDNPIDSQRLEVFISSVLSSQAQALKEQRCARCNGTFLEYQHMHVTRNGAFHTKCYKVNNLGYQQGQKDMKEQMKACVPEARESVRVAYIEGTSTPDPDKSILFKENVGFNDCREQTLSAIESIEI